MDFDEKLTAFQGVIFAADSTCPFSTLTSKGGNDTEVRYVVNSIREYLHKENHLVENEMNEDSMNLLRKFAFYIVINGDLEILKKLIDYEGLDYVIWTLPTVPKYLMCEILWQLNMDIFLHEIIVFSCPRLAIEVAEAVIENYKNLDPDSVDKLKILSIACYKQLYRLTFVKINLSMVLKSFRNFENCLKYFRDPPNVIKLKYLENDEKYKFMGRQFYSLLHLTKESLEMYTTSVKFKSNDFQEIYLLTFGEDEIVNNSSNFISISENQTLADVLDRANFCLLDTCKHLAMQINVDVFCSWSEFQFDDEKNFQKAIGSLSYKIINLLQKIEKLTKHSVGTFLKEIATKPINYSEIINIISTKDILLRIKNEDDRQDIIKALLSKKNLCEDKYLIEQIDTHLELLNEGECIMLFKILTEYLKFNDSTELDHLKLLAIKSFEHCSLNSKTDLVANYFSTTVFVNSLETSEFDSMLTETFNKLFNTNTITLTSIYKLFIQNPRKIFTKIISLPSESIELHVVMLGAINQLQPYLNHYYEEDILPCFIQVIKDVSKQIGEKRNTVNNFSTFLKHLKRVGYITGSKLLLLVIMPNLHMALLNKRVFDIFVQCNLIHDCFPIPELGEYKPAILAMFAQVLDTLRWKMNTYSPMAPVTLELVIKIQLQIMGSYGPQIPDKDGTWLRRKIKNINPLNMYYYKLLWQPPGNTFAEIISGIRIHEDMDRQVLTIWLSQVLCSAISVEWILIWQSLLFFNKNSILTLFNDALLLLIVAEKSINTEASKLCIMDHCIKGFVNIIRFSYFDPKITEKEIETVFTKLILLENLIEEDDVNSFCTYTLPLLSYIAQEKPDINIDLLEMLEAKLKHKNIFSMFYDLFLAKKEKKMNDATVLFS